MKFSKHIRISLLLAAALAAAFTWLRAAQDPDEPVEVQPQVIVVAPDQELLPDDENEDGPPEEVTLPDRGVVSEDAQRDAASAVSGAAGATDPRRMGMVPGGSDRDRSRESTRSRDRTPRDWRSSFRATGSRSGRSPSGTNAPAGPANTEYAYYQVINNRNIFNPARQPNVPDRPARDTRKPPKVDSFSLVGTLRYDKGTTAFFDGSGSEFRKARRIGDEIAGYKIVSVSESAVRLAGKEKTIELPIGSQMRREDEGEWALASGAFSGSSRSESGSGSSSSSTGSSPVASTGSEGSGSGSTASSTEGSGSGGGSADDVLKRLLQRREQEMNK